MTLGVLMLPLALLPLALAYAPGSADTPEANGSVDPTHEASAGLTDSVDLFSGGLTISERDVCVPGYAGLSLCAERTYTSKVTDEYLVPVSDDQWAGLGWSMVPGGRIYFDATLDAAYPSTYVRVDLPGHGTEVMVALDTTSAYWRDAGDSDAWPDMDAGCSEAYVGRDFSFLYRTSSGAVDADGVTLCDEYKAITTDGLVYTFHTDDATQADGWLYGTEIENAHGESIDLVYQACADSQAAGALDTMTFADGRGLSFGVDASCMLSSVSYVDANGATDAITYTMTADTSGTTLTAVTSPTGETTRYEYDGTYDELTAQVSSEGGEIDYDYDTVSFVSDVSSTGTPVILESRVVTERVERPDTSTANTWTYVWDDYYAGGPTGTKSDATDYRVTEVIAPDGGTTLHEYGNFAYTTSSTTTKGVKTTTVTGCSVPEWVGLPIWTLWYSDATRSTLLRWTYTDWLDASSPFGINAIQVSDHGAPYSTWSYRYGLLVPVPNAVYHGYTSSFAASSEDLYGLVGDGARDLYGNPLSMSTVFTNPTWDATSTSLYWGTLTQTGYAWSDDDAIAGWNLVRLVASETTGTTTNGSTIATAYTEGTTTYVDSGDALGWPEVETITSTGTSIDSSGAAITNPSPDEVTTSSYTFSSGGVVSTRRDLGGVRTQLTTTTYGTVSETGWSDGSTDTILSTSTVDANTGLALDVTDANGETTRTTYDAMGRPLTVTPPDGDATMIAYNLVVTGSNPTPNVTVTVGDEAASTVTFDGMGRAIARTSPWGTMTRGTHTAQQYRVTDEVTYNAMGQIDTAYHPRMSTDAAGASVQTTYDALGRPTTVTEVGSDGTTQVNTTAYSFPTTTKTDPAGHVSTEVMDGFGNVVQTTPATGATASMFGTGSTTAPYAGHVVVTIASDPAGVLTSVGQVVALDGKDRTWSVTDDQSGTRTFVRNAAGDLTCEWGDNGEYVVSTFDIEGRKTSITFDTSCIAVNDPTYTFYYDGDVPTDLSYTWTAAYPEGRLTAAEGPGGTDTYSYDAMGHVVATRHDFPAAYAAELAGIDPAETLTWDGEGRLASLTYTQGFSLFGGAATFTLTPAYDGGKLVSATLDTTTRSGTDSQVLVSGIEWAPSGRMRSALLGNGITESMVEDAFDRLSVVSWRGGFTRFRATTTFTSSNLPDTTTTILNGETNVDTFSYDAIDRLTKVARDDGTAITYGYDAFGNVTDIGGSAATALGIDEAGLVYAGNHGTTATYGDEGEMLSDGVDTYTYDSLGRLATITDGTASTTSILDAAGAEAIRIESSDGVNTMMTVNIGDGLGHVVATYAKRSDWGRGFATFHAVLGSREVATVTPRPTGNTITYLHYDGRHDLRLITDDAGHPVGGREPTPYGPLRQDLGARRTFPVEYAGHRGLDLFDVSLFGVRGYHGVYARFLSPDRFSLGGVVDPQSLNRYAYSRDNPILYEDPTGMGPELLPAVGTSVGLLEAFDVGCTVWDLYHVHLDYEAGNVGALIVDGGLTVLGGLVPGGEQSTLWAARAMHLVPKDAMTGVYLQADYLAKDYVGTKPLRRMGGVAWQSASIAPVEGTWIRDGVGAMPGQIASQLVGLRFNNWDAFRKRFWHLVSLDSDLSRAFSAIDPAARATMFDGRAPYAPAIDRTGKGASNERYNLDHVLPISGGRTASEALSRQYWLNNIVVMTPKRNQAKGGR